MTTTDFLCALVITNFCLNYLQALTSNLQAEAKDIVAAIKEIDGVIATLQNVRDNISTHHRRWYSSVEIWMKVQYHPYPGGVDDKYIEATSLQILHLSQGRRSRSGKCRTNNSSLSPKRCLDRRSEKKTSNQHVLTCSCRL